MKEKGKSNRSANGWGVQNRLLSSMEDRDDASCHNTIHIQKQESMVMGVSTIQISARRSLIWLEVGHSTGS